MKRYVYADFSILYQDINGTTKRIEKKRVNEWKKLLSELNAKLITYKVDQTADGFVLIEYL